MTRKLTLTLGLLGLSAAVLLVHASGDEARPPQVDRMSRESALARAKAVAERNIFRKDRRRRGSEERRPQVEAPRPRPPEERYRLAGVVRRGEVFTAILEDAQTNGLLRKQVGDELASGKIAAIELDAIQYASGSTTTKVLIGADLTGSASSSQLSAGRGRSEPRPDRSSPGRSDGPARRPDPASVEPRGAPAQPSSSTPESPSSETSSSSTPSSEESLIERLRRRRLEEQGAK